MLRAHLVLLAATMLLPRAPPSQDSKGNEQPQNEHFEV